MTDGNSTDSLQVESLPGSLPIFPVLSDDSRSPQPDLSIGAVSVSQTNFEDAPVSVQARIAGSGDFSGRIRVMLEPYPATDESGSDRKSVPDTPSVGDTEQRQTITLAPQADQDVVARFQVKPPRPGVLFYRLRVVPDENSQVFDKPELSREATLANNERLIAVNRDAHVFRILYVGGRPNWERKFLGRALEEDDRLQLVSLVRIARKEARFDFRGRVGESSNPLFRGFKEEVDEETESYNQPVLVRMNVRDNSELSDGFPKAKAELYRYDAVILDDIESAFFTRDQLSLLDKFVSERGGGLLMLGGRDTFQHGKWDNTPIADALPVYLDRTGDRLTAPLHWQLTREGLLEPWMRVRDTEQAEQRRLENVASRVDAQQHPRRQTGRARSSRRLRMSPDGKVRRSWPSNTAVDGPEPCSSATYGNGRCSRNIPKTTIRARPGGRLSAGWWETSRSVWKFECKLRATRQVSRTLAVSGTLNWRAQWELRSKFGSGTASFSRRRGRE